MKKTFVPLTASIPFFSSASFLVFITFIIFFSGCAAGAVNASVEVLPTILVTMQNVSITPSTIYLGGSADIAVVLENSGNIATDTVAEAVIYDSLNVQVDNISYDPVNLTPGSTSTQVKTWSSAGLTEGSYRIVARAYYDNWTTQTNSVETTFTISLPTPTTQPPAGGAGALPEVTPMPRVLPPVIIPTSFGVRFVRRTVLKEIVAGEGSFETLSFENYGETTQTVGLSIEGASTQWIGVKEGAQEVTLMPGDMQVVNVGLSIPENALPGDYLVKLELKNGNVSAQDFMIVRVKRYPLFYDKPIALKTISLDYAENVTRVSIAVRNPSETKFDNLQLMEEIPLTLASGLNEIDFVDKPTAVISEKPVLVAWEIGSLDSFEEKTLSYSIHNGLSDYGIYTNWFVKQLTLPKKISLAELMEIREISGYGLEPGKNASVYVNVFNKGFNPLEVVGSIVAPDSFTVKTVAQRKTLPPRGVATFAFEMQISKDLLPSTQSVSVVFARGEDSVSKTFSLSIEVPQPDVKSLASTLLFLIALGAVAVLIVLGALSAANRWRNRSVYSEARSNYLGEIKHVFKSSEPAPETREGKEGKECKEGGQGLRMRKT